MERAALREGAEARLARSRATNLQPSSLKVAAVKLNVAPRSLKASKERKRTSDQAEEGESYILKIKTVAYTQNKSSIVPSRLCRSAT